MVHKIACGEGVYCACIEEGCMHNLKFGELGCTCMYTDKRVWVWHVEGVARVHTGGHARGVCV